MRSVLGKKADPAEMQQTLTMQRVKLEQVQSKLSGRMEQSRQEARKALEVGDESGFRVASRKYSLSKSTASSINDLREMAMEMTDLVEMGGILSTVIGAGGDLAKIQGRLGLDSSKLESSLSRIRASMTHMEDIANVLSATIETSISNPKQLSADQEVLRKELLTEMAVQKIDAEKVKEQVSKELQKA
jgi:hypothetical protein